MSSATSSSTFVPTSKTILTSVSLGDLRNAVIQEGVPDALRCQIWKILLRVPSVDAARYKALVARGAASHYAQIRRDTSRTFREKGRFLVPEEKISRLLNALMHAASDAAAASTTSTTTTTAIATTNNIVNVNNAALSKVTYIQGLNVVAAVFLHVMPELDAYFCCEAFVKAHCAYFQRGSVSDALFIGCELVHKCLRDHDPELSDRFVAAKIPVQFVLSSVMTFSADSPPLREVVLLWDYMFAAGTHLNVFLITARLMLARTTLLQPTNVTKMLGKDLPRVSDANAVIALATQLYLKSSRKLIDRCKRHASTSGSGSTPPTPTAIGATSSSSAATAAATSLSASPTAT
jgi:cell cycle arrest protein BUB2